ncbi:GNAT family N-acetyltransferase [Aquisphaera insulae]|uniref:GNAT family N-acetyltransferase n=1 Tax=Aquisphaera insulae TaxID=2712864 RepID=UPI0013EDC91D|nr:GNAT family N-acetyltransferase [Aquisphaera insulae]
MAESCGDVWSIVRLGPGHDRTGFDCGNPFLNDWLKQRAGQFEKRDLARTFVATKPASGVVLGYYAISNHRVRHEDLPAAEARGLPRLDVPVLLLGRLAVDRTTQGQGLGSHLLIDALRRAQYLAEHVGIRAVEVDAIDDSARQFYLQFGFVPLLDDPNHLFLSMQIIRKLGLPPLERSSTGAL